MSTLTTRSRVRQHLPEITAILAVYGFHNPRVFGSLARGTDHPNSDLDLLVDADDSANILDLSGARLDIQDLIGAPVDIVIDEGLRPSFARRVHSEMKPLPDLAASA